MRLRPVVPSTKNFVSHGLQERYERMFSRHNARLAARALCLGSALLAKPVLAQHTLDGVIFDTSVGTPYIEVGGANFTPDLITMSHNDTGVAALLTAPNFPAHAFKPLPLSPALGANDLLSTIQYAGVDTCPRPGCTPTRHFVQTCYRGAVDPNGADWPNASWVCWPTAISDPLCEPPNGTFVFKSGPQAASETWTANNTYVVDGKVNYLSGTTLTIQPGVKILGTAGGTPSYIVI